MESGGLGWGAEGEWRGGECGWEGNHQTFTSSALAAFQCTHVGPASEGGISSMTTLEHLGWHTQSPEGSHELPVHLGPTRTAHTSTHACQVTQSLTGKRKLKVINTAR